MFSRDSGSPRAGKNQSIELRSHLNPEFSAKSGITNRSWRGDEQSLNINEGGCERLVIRGSSKENNVKTVSVKVEERRGSIGRNEEGV